MNFRHSWIGQARCPLFTLLAVLCSAPLVSAAAFVDRSDELGVSGGNEACWFDFNNDGWVDICAGGKVFRNNGGADFTEIANTGATVAADFDNDGWVDLYSWSGRQIYRNSGGTGFIPIAIPTLPPGGSIGASWGDLNNDGFVDLYVGGYESWPAETYADFILTNRGGTFDLTWSEVRFRARGVTSCDFDRDGDLDIYVSNYRLQPNVLWLNNGDATFQDATGAYNAVATDPGFGGGHSIGAAFGDFDNDGHIDLFAGNFAHDDNRGDQPESRWLRNRGPAANHHFEDLGQRGVFYQESYSSPTTGDYDNDGDLDLFFTTIYGTASFGRPNNPVMFRNDGAFNFSDARGETALGGLPPTYQAAFADFDNDGDLDLMTAGRLYVNQGGSGHSWLKVRLIGDGANVNRSAIGAQVRIPLPGGQVLTRQVEAGVGQGNQNDLTLHFGLGTHREPVDLEIFWPDATTQNVEAVALNQTLTLSRQPLAEIVPPAGALWLEAGAGLLLLGEAAEAGVAMSWSLDSAPPGGDAIFDDADEATTAVRFTKLGEYLVRLTGEQDGLTTFDTMAVTVVPHGPPSRPTAWWKLDDGAGALAADASGWNRHGTRVGFADGVDGWTAQGVRGGALSFEPEAGEFVDLQQDAGSVANLSSSTVAVWFRSDAVGERTLFSLSNDSSELRLYLKDGFLQFHLRGSTLPIPPALRSPVQVNDSQWHHAAATCDRSGLATLFLDGTPVAYGWTAPMAAVADADQMAIGKTAAVETGHHFRGELDDLRVYRTALSPDEVAGLAVVTGDLAAAPLIVPYSERYTVPSPRVSLSVLSPEYIHEGSITRWEQADGPGTANFSDPAQRTGEIEFPTPGTYQLRMFAEGTGATSFREITVEHPPGNPDAPIGVAIDDLTLSPGGGAHEIELFPLFFDPGDHSSTLQFSVSVAADGEGLLQSAEVLGGGAEPARLVLQPEPDADGGTLVTVRAEDPAGNATEISFTLTVANFAPLALDLSLEIAELAPAGTVLGSIAALDPDSDPIRFHLRSGNHDNAFALDLVSGELSVRNPEAIDFETHPDFTLQVAVTDPKHPAYDRPATVTVAVTDLEEAPRVADERFLIRTDALAGALVGSVSGSDPDGAGALTYSIVGGDPTGAFAIDPASGQITLADPAPLVGQPRFELEVRAQDLASSTADATVVILPVQTLIADGASGRWIVPADGLQDAGWRRLDHDDSAWTESPMGLGYDTSPNYLPLIATDVDAQMRDQNTGIYLRLRFDVPDPASIGPLILRALYDDGFIAYLNGTMVAAQNASEAANWQSGASGQHADTEAVLPEDFELGRARELLVAGENLLAIHGLNHLITSSDFLLSAELLAAARQPGIKLLPEGATVRWKVPRDDSEDEFWAGETFDDSAWASGAMGLGYDTGTDYLPFIGTDLAAAMQTLNTGVYLRAPFDVADPSEYASVSLRMRYDDGFIAFLNGILVASGNAPQPALSNWQSAATTSHDDPQAMQFSEFPLSGTAVDRLVPGQNLLAIHGLNVNLASSDFLVSAELVGEPSGPPPPSGSVSLHNEGASGIDFDAAAVNCEVGATGGAPAHLFVAWAMADQGRAAVEHWPNLVYVGTTSEPGLFSARLRGLSSGTTYTFRFYAERPDGDGAADGWSPPATFSTPAHDASILVADGSPMLALIPTAPDEAPGWRENDFQPSGAWLAGGAGAGFDITDDFAPLIGLDLRTAMHLHNASAYLRCPFSIGSPASIDSLTLRMRYDDGFVAYLNGIEIARANAPSDPVWNSAATAAHPDLEAQTPVDFDVSPYLGVLVPGANTLAIHGLNTAASGSDFVIAPELVATGDPGQLTGPPPTVTLLAEGAPARVLVPTARIEGWANQNFDDRAWQSGTIGIGYERASGYQDLIGLDVEQAMFGVNTSVYLRVPFALADPGALEGLTLRMKYDDGFVAHLNGVRVASANTGGSVSNVRWNSATVSHDDSLAVQFEDFDISNYLAALQPGANVLAIQGLNAGLGSSDLLLLPELIALGDPGRLGPFDAWAIGHGLAGADAQPGADPDRDGTDNFGEFAFAGSPLVPDRERTGAHVVPTANGQALAITYHRPTDATALALTYRIEGSSELALWNVIANVLEIGAIPTPDGSAEEVTALVPIDSAQFVRVVAHGD